MGTLEGRAAVITGGASGIGKATARLFAEEGCRVLIAEIQDEKGERLADDLGEDALYLHTNVSREADVEAAVSLTLEAFGRLDCMFNNAGIP